MFSWCAYCQHLIGEVPPLDDFTVTHGMCLRCHSTIETFEPSEELLLAKELFGRLERAGRAGDFGAAEAAVDEALAAGLVPSEVIVGVLHPVLGRVGQRWASGQITVADEHAFTGFVLRVIDRLRLPEPPSERPLVMLAVHPENRHDVGVRMLQILSWERAIPCDRIPVGTTERELLDLVVARRPNLFGLSVSLFESIPSALALARALEGVLPDDAELVLGGQAFRRDGEAVAFGDVPVVPTIDGFVARLDRLAAATTSTAAARSAAIAPATDPS